MKYSVGSRLGPYEIHASIGAGGMGQVFRARDTRLGRDVAVKVLPPDFSDDPERLLRFEQEARAAGILNHPNILVIHDIGTDDGTPYVVSELLEGETLRDRMETARLPISKAIEYALQAARGLAAAHAKGIVHRDLKPENLFITRDGHVKILDFGLAKLLQNETSEDTLTQLPTRAVRTQVGKIMGTVGYMSPEQLRGQPTDYRSDIFSFGVVLYEMVAGERPFQRDSSADTMSAILKEDPRELAGGDREVPPALERIIQHCLEKRPEDRFQSTRDVAFAIEALTSMRDAEPEEVVPVAGKKKGAQRTSKIRTVVATLPTYRQLTFRRGTVFSARLAPEGSTIVYSAAWDGEPIELYSTRSGFPESRALGFRNAHLHAVSSSGELAISLDSRFLSHRQFLGTLARVPLEGSAPRALLEDVSEADWSPDGKSYAVVRHVEGRNRLEFPVGTVLYETTGWVSHPRIGPKGKLIAFLDHPIRADDRGSVAVVDLAGNRKTLCDGWAGIEGLAWSADGHEVWFTAAEAGLARALYAVSLAGRHRLVNRMAGGLILHDIAADGRLLVIRDIERSEIMGRFEGETRERNLSWLDLSVAIDLSDDGSKLLFMEQGVAVGSTYAACLRKTDGSPAMRLGEGTPHGLSPDGKWALAIVYGTTHQLVLLPTGAGEPRPLPGHGFEAYSGARWVPDGKHIVFVGRRPGEASRCCVQDLAGGEPRTITTDEVELRGVPVSPDGRMVACVGPDRRTALYPLSGGVPRPVPGSVPGEILIRWGDDGNSLFVYKSGGLPAQIERIALDSGQRTNWLELEPSDSAGVSSIGQIRLTPNGRACVYSFKRTLSELYLVEGQF